MTYARIGIFEMDGQEIEPIIALFREHVTPAFETLSGYLGYQAFVDPGSSRYVGISYWESLAHLKASEEAARAAREKAADLGARVVGDPMIVEQAFDTRNAAI